LCFWLISLALFVGIAKVRKQELFGRISAALHASNVGADDYLGGYLIWRNHGRFVFPSRRVDSPES